jgi:hypothetical protein
LVATAAACANLSTKTTSLLTHLTSRRTLGILSPVSLAAAAASTTLSPTSSIPNSKASPSKIISSVPASHDVTTTFNDDDSCKAFEEESMTTSSSSDFILNDFDEKHKSSGMEHTKTQESKTTAKATMKVHKLKDISGGIATKSIHIQDIYKVTLF